MRNVLFINFILLLMILSGCTNKVTLSEQDINHAIRTHFENNENYTCDDTICQNRIELDINDYPKTCSVEQISNVSLTQNPGAVEYIVNLYFLKDITDLTYNYKKVSFNVSYQLKSGELNTNGFDFYQIEDIGILKDSQNQICSETSEMIGNDFNINDYRYNEAEFLKDVKKQWDGYLDEVILKTNQ